jgi:hypothetical protein
MNNPPNTLPRSPQSPLQSDSAMVSHAEVAERSSSRSHRAPSVSSQTTRTRSKHHSRGGRSHYDGGNYAPQNEFPFFAQTGDVEIVIAADGHEKRYLLHRLILAQCSAFFEAGLSDEWSRAQRQPEALTSAMTIIGEESEVGSATGPTQITPEQASRRPPGQRRWRYELDWNSVAEDEEPMLVQRQSNPGALFQPEFTSIPPPVAPRGPPPARSNSFFRSMANLTIHGHSQSTTNLPVNPPPPDPASLSPLIRDYDNLFRTFYNYTPQLNNLNIASAYSECKALLALADMYDCLPIIGSRVDHHLLRFSSRLFKQIAKYPPSYLRLGYLSRSRIIFSEALTHVVGQWPQPQPYLQDTVPESVLELIEDKVDELDELRSKVEMKLFRLTLTTSRGERVTPANDYLGWLAMSLFRQWVAENTTPPPPPILKNNTARTTHANLQTNPLPPPPPSINTGRVYRLIGSTNSQGYLAHEELKRFLKLQPTASSSRDISLYNRDNLRRFERRVEEVKNIARDLVKPLTRNCLELDMSGEQGRGIPYLTCTKLEDSEVPWD